MQKRFDRTVCMCRVEKHVSPPNATVTIQFSSVGNDGLKISCLIPTDERTQPVLYALSYPDLLIEGSEKCTYTEVKVNHEGQVFEGNARQADAVARVLSVSSENEVTIHLSPECVIGSVKSGTTTLYAKNRGI